MDDADGRPAAEDALLHRVREGDAAAFAALFDSHADGLAASVRRLVPPAIRRKVSVSDVLQETRIAAFLGVADFEHRGAGSFRAWLLRIAQHKAHHAAERYGDAAKRSVRREVTLGARRATAAHAEGGPTPSEAAMSLELAQSVHRAIASLPPAYQEVLRLTRIEGRTLAEAAERMDRTREAVKKLYGRAMTRFAAAYAAQSGTDRG
jgi:RNA polymerase sigma-70 factor (ECF subfamily)